jgi:2-amino-4-hydroxy-6-hydroxymethyldihydropteridine diphosphokinase
MQAVLNLGGNIGTREIFLQNAVRELQKHIFIQKISSFYESKAWGITEQPDFLNISLAAEVNFSPFRLLDLCLKTEQKFGRVRTGKWHERTIDIDILYFGSDIIKTKILTIPHPFIAERRFVLMPTVEILPDFLHPEYGLTQRFLLENCSDSGFVRQIHKLDC